MQATFVGIGTFDLQQITQKNPMAAATSKTTLTLELTG